MKTLSNALNKTGEMNHVKQRVRDEGTPQFHGQAATAKPPPMPHRTFWNRVERFARMQGKLTPTAKQVLKAMRAKADLHKTPHLVVISHPQIMNDAEACLKSIKTATSLLETLKIATPITPKGRLGDKPTEYLITRPYPADEEDERGGYHLYCENIWRGVARYFENDRTHQQLAWARFLHFDSGGALEIEHEGETPTRNFLITLVLKPIIVGERTRKPPAITEGLVRSIESNLTRLEELACQYSDRKIQIKVNL